MMETRTYRSVRRNRKKGSVPLSKLRTSEAVKTVVDHPRRMEELVEMLEDKDRILRGRAAAALARLSESHPGRLLRMLERVKYCLSDDSAYVRWHLCYTLGCLGKRFPGKAARLVPELGSRLEDDNRIVRVFASGALGSIAALNPDAVQDFFQAAKREMPSSLSKMLRKQ
jgi:HEAT repeat protein